MEKVRIDLVAFENKIFEVFSKYGFNPLNAKISTDVLFEADLKSIESHGIARLLGYIRLVKEKRINPEAKLRITRERTSTLNIDADGAIGMVSARFGMEKAIEKAKKTGICFATIHNSNHFGIAQAHALLAVEKNMIGFAMTNASPLVSIPNTKEATFGTNPICYAIPGGKNFPFICDVATSAVSNGKLELKQYAGLPIPEGWAVDSEGNPSIDNKILSKKGTLVALGSDEIHSYHKGYALSGLVDILTGVLSGANFGKHVPPFVPFLNPISTVGEGIGHVVGAIDIDAFMDFPEFESRMEMWCEEIKSLKAINQANSILIPGEPEAFAKERNLKNGYLEILKSVWESVLSL